jgi:transcriptional regulator with XRE-family HTH domain
MPKTTTSDIASIVVGSAIKRARREVGITQAELARRLGTSPPYVSMIESGASNLTVGQMSSVASALGVEMRVDFVVHEARQEPSIPVAALSA